MSTLNSRAFWDGGSDTSDDDYISEQRGRDMQGNQEPRAASGWGFSLKSMPVRVHQQIFEWKTYQNSFLVAWHISAAYHQGSGRELDCCEY